VDELIRGLNGNGCYTMGDAGDIAILIGGKFLIINSRASTGGSEYGTTVV
jgi:hypothetical protein